MGCLGDMGIHGSRRDFTEELVKHPHKLVLRSSHSRDDADVLFMAYYVLHMFFCEEDEMDCQYCVLLSLPASAQAKRSTCLSERHHRSTITIHHN